MATDPRGAGAAHPDRRRTTRAPGCWHLPGGGTDYGEQPGAALIRELVEETGQRGRLVELLGVASHRDAASLGPEGYPIDWHGVRAFYRVMVDRADPAQGRTTSAAPPPRPAGCRREELADLARTRSPR